MKEKFQYILDHYNDGSRIVDKTTELYSVLVRLLPGEIKDFIDSPDHIVKGSMGQGYKTDYPWIAVLNRNLTTSTQHGIYIVFLFKRDMSGFYLSLDQGITHFDKMFRSNKYEYAQKVAEYFRSQLGESSFSTGEISLGGKRGDLGYGYEKTTVVAKYYPSNQFNEDMLKMDLIELMDIYDLIIQHMSTKSYDSVIKNIIEEEQDAVIDGDSAIEQIKDIVDPDDSIPFGYNRTMQEVVPYSDLSHRFRRLTTPKSGKIDYLKKAERDAKAGLLGEELAIKFEQQRLIDLGREDLADKVSWVSKRSDAYGYVIQSYNVDDSGSEYKIYIEVKTTSNRVDTEFFVSRNEVDRSAELNKNYCVFRIYDVNSEYPKFYKVFGKIEDNFILDPVTFMARYKGAA